MTRNRTRARCGVRPSSKTIYVRPHALERYRMHHDHALFRDVLEAWDTAFEVDPATAQYLATRSRLRTGSIYRVSADLLGMFVVVPSQDRYRRPFHMVTYLRFGYEQRAFAARYWGEGAGSSTSAPLEGE